MVLVMINLLSSATMVSSRPKPDHLSQSFQQVISHPQGIGHDGQSRIHRPTRWEKAGVDDREVVDVVGLAMDIERRGLGSMSEANGAVLVRHAGQWNALADEQIASKQALVTGVAMHGALRLLLHQATQFGDETRVALCVIGLVAEHDVAVTVQRDPILRVRQMLRGEGDRLGRGDAAIVFDLAEVFAP
jgi:hypothetical protein